MLKTALSLFLTICLIGLFSTAFAQGPVTVSVGGSIINKTNLKLKYGPSSWYVGQIEWNPPPAGVLDPQQKTYFFAKGKVDKVASSFTAEFVYADPNDPNSTCDIALEYMYDSGFYAGQPTCSGKINAYTVPKCDPNGSNNATNNYVCSFEIVPAN